MEENRITVEDAIRMTIDLLEGIDVPVKKLNEIGVPLRQAVDNLVLCVQAIEANRQPQEQKEPEIEIVPFEIPAEEVEEETINE